MKIRRPKVKAEVQTTASVKKSLMEEHQSYMALLQMSTDTFGFLNADGTLGYISPAARRRFGHVPSRRLGTKVFELVHPDDVSKAQALFQDLLKADDAQIETELRIMHNDGSSVICAVVVRNRLHDPNIHAIVLTYRDVTEQRQMEQELRDTGARFRALVQNSSDVFAIVDSKRIVHYVSDATETVLGYDVSSVVSKDVCERLHPEDVSLMQRFHDKLLLTKADTLTIEVRILNREGEWRDFEVKGRNLFHEPSIKGIVLNYHDITEKKRIQQQLNHIEHHDALTNVPNRRAFEETLRNQLMVAKLNRQRLAVLHMNLDRFGFVNDTFGHATGDELLKQVSARLLDCLPHDVMLAHMGSDEFTVLIPRIRIVEEAAETAKDVLEAFAAPFELEGNELYITPSIGISMYPEDGDNVEDIRKHADMALSKAKELGANQFQVYTPTMNVETYKKFVIHNDLHKAVANQELAVFYQPRVQASTGRIVSAEALVRWTHAEWGPISPKDFIPIAEQTGLIVTIGQWVLEEVCRQLKAWQNAGLPSIPVSVNFSGIQFMKTDVVATVFDVLEQTGLDPEWLELEVTESAFMDDEGSLLRAIELLYERGIYAAIDDFGTGYSSLGRMNRSKMKTLKIDRSFIQGIDHDAANATIVKAIIQMAHGLGMTVVAEGVETKQELDFLRNEHCDEIQGYLFSRPVPPEEFSQLLQRRTLTLNEGARKGPNRRRYFRILLPYALQGDMTVTRINGKDVSIGGTTVLIQDIGPGGLRFASDIRLPVTPHMVLAFRLGLYGETELFGHVVWSNEIDLDVQEYGVKFLMTENDVVDLTKKLNKLAIELRQVRNPALQRFDFYDGNPAHYFRNGSQSLVTETTEQ